MQYTDLSVIHAFSVLRGKRDFVTFMSADFDGHVADTPEARVYWIGKWIEKNEKIEGIEKGEKDHFIFRLESNLIPVLARMEETGVAIDEKKLQDIGERIREDMRRTETEIYEVVGERFNINSPKQIQVILFEKLKIKPTKKNKTGYSVDTEVLDEIEKEYDIARLILEYRTLAKLDSTYIAGLLKSIDPITKRIHTTYDSLGAATGRMSSNDPNLQNIPAGEGYAKEIKSCFIPSKGNILLVADYSQVELRVLAFLSQDPNLLDAFEKGEDIHMRTAKFLFPNKDIITKEERRIAKTVNFGVIYGITGFGLSKTLGCSPHEANQYIDAFYAKYPKVREYYDTILENARKTGYVETYFGRRRYIHSMNDANKTIRSIAEREAMNMPVQGTAADMIKLAMVELDAKIRDSNLKGSMILQVHDELVFDVSEGEQEIFEKMVRETMEQILIKNKQDIHDLSRFPPIEVDISVGKDWAEAK